MESGQQAWTAVSRMAWPAWGSRCENLDFILLFYLFFLFCCLGSSLWPTDFLFVLWAQLLHGILVP